MKKIFLILAYLVTALGIAATAVLYPSLPEQIPMHWNIHGVVDSYGTKPQIFLIPILMVIIITFLIFIPKIDPKKENYKSFQSYYDIFIFAMSLFFLAMQVIILKMSFSPDSIQMNSVMPILIGALFVVIGFVMPKFTHNYFVGIKGSMDIIQCRKLEKNSQICRSYMGSRRNFDYIKRIFAWKLCILYFNDDNCLNDVSAYHLFLQII